MQESLKKREDKKFFLQALKEQEDRKDKDASKYLDKLLLGKNDVPVFDHRKIRLPVEKQSVIYDNVEKYWPNYAINEKIIQRDKAKELLILVSEIEKVDQDLFDFIFVSEKGKSAIQQIDRGSLHQFI